MFHFDLSLDDYTDDSVFNNKKKFKFFDTDVFDRTEEGFGPLDNRGMTAPGSLNYTHHL